MSYFNYHAVVKRLIAEGKLCGYYFTPRYHAVSPALVLLFNDVRRPIVPIRDYRWEEYLPLLPKIRM